MVLGYRNRVAGVVAEGIVVGVAVGQLDMKHHRDAEESIVLGVKVVH